MPADVIRAGAIPPEPDAARRHLPVLTLTLAGVALVAFLWPAAGAALVYDRAAISQGQIWRLATGHCVHFSPSHLAWDLLVFGLAGATLERQSPAAMRWLVAIGAPVIGLVLFGLQPALLRYGGLSGLAAGAIVMLALREWRAGAARWFWGGILAGLAAKIALESLRGQALLADFGGEAVRPVPLAHIAGALVAVALAAAGWRRQRGGGSR